MDSLRESSPTPEVVVSPDGKLVGVLNGDRVALCDAASAKLV